MRVVIQRCARASVSVEGSILSEIGSGLLILLGVDEKDSTEDAEWLAKRLPKLRIFSDDEGKMNLSLLDVGADAIVVSQSRCMPIRRREIARRMFAQRTQMWRSHCTRSLASCFRINWESPWEGAVWGGHGDKIGQ